MHPAFLIAALLASLAEGPLLFAQNFEEAHSQATDVASGSLFLFNPAVPQAHADRAALGLVLPRGDDRNGFILGSAVAKSGSGKREPTQSVRRKATRSVLARPGRRSCRSVARRRANLDAG